MPICLIGLGSNIGDRHKTLQRATALLGRHPAVRVAALSRWYETAPVGGPANQEAFLNGAVLLETSLAPHEVAALLFDLEAQLGRVRRRRWGPRTLDLDLLLYDRLVIETPRLVVPHPRMAWRRFVLEPASEIAPSMIHPTIGWSIARLLSHLESAVSYVAITGPPAAGKSELARSLVDARSRSHPGSARLIADPVGSRPEESHGAICPSNAFQAEIECLRKRARLLAADLPDWRSPGGPAISDFWFDQSLCYAQESLNADALAAVKRQWEELASSVVPPKLLVVLDASGSRVGRALGDLARQPGRGPVLFAKDPRLDLVTEEVLAAIDAMLTPAT